jgi:pimeloyl-ACP methyl ester carboxylesterase
MYVLDSFDVILHMFMTDQTIRLLPSTVPLFIPDIPGYGASTPSQTAHDKGTIGQAILFALAECLKQKGLSAPYPIIFTGHDRGGRIVHRLAVDAPTYTEQFDVLGVAMLDIVPTVVQWEGMQRPAEAAGFFHWPFLANVDLATQILMTVGGDVFLQMMFDRWRGALTPKGTENFYADGALDVYKTSFKQESVIRASNLDYEAGAKQDVVQQRKDQAEGRKLTIPSLALYSASGIGKRFDVPGTWKDWVAKESLLTAQGVGEGAGHFFAEENPEETVEKLLAWYRTLGAYQ